MYIYIYVLDELTQKVLMDRIISHFWNEWLLMMKNGLRMTTASENGCGRITVSSKVDGQESFAMYVIWLG